MNRVYVILGIILSLSFLVRIWDISNSPPSLYWDEMDVGYQAYSILKTGKDYFGSFPGFSVHSFADFRAPLLIYITIPFAAFLGLNAFSVRLPAVLLGTLSVLLIYLLSKILFKSEKISLVAAILVGLSSWNIQYSRMAFEGTLLLSLFLVGLICFLKGLRSSKWWIVTGVLFGLGLFAYNTAKLFLPLMLMVLSLIYIRKKNISRNFLIGLGIFCSFFIAALYSSIFQGGGTRFAEIAIWTYPQLDSSIDQYRHESAISYTKNRELGMKARIIDKLVYNKVTFVAEKFTNNYFQSLSPDFLFINGDPNLRHSPYRIGEFYRVELITIVSGLMFLFIRIRRRDKSSIFLFLWLILAPIPASLTREGGTHASRLFLLFPVLSIVSALGFIYILELVPKKTTKIVFWITSFLWIFGVIFYLNYYFGAYRLESAKYFQYGFKEAVSEAINRKAGFKYVIIDDRKDSSLMNFLFQSKYAPADFQNEISGLPSQLGKFKADKLENFYFMKPGRRDWYEAFKDNLINEDYLLIASSEQLEEQTIEKLPGRLTENQKLLDVIYYQNGDPAFYIIESKNRQN